MYGYLAQSPEKLRLAGAADGLAGVCEIEAVAAHRDESHEGLEAVCSLYPSPQSLCRSVTSWVPS